MGHGEFESGRRSESLLNLARLGRKSETRNPKAERNPKLEIRKPIQAVGKPLRIVEDRIVQRELFVENARACMIVVRIGVTLVDSRAE